MTSQLARDLNRRRALGVLALGAGGAALALGTSRSRAQGALACIRTPTETRGPYPADGSNGGARPLNVLNLDGVIRRDIRGSFAGMRGRAEGVPVELELSLAGGRDCRALEGAAFYLWQNDAAGEYSLYTLPEVNYLRGMQVAQGGRVHFTTVLPGCYGGRAPHCHFEVFASRAAALAGEAPLLVSQLAFPAAECRAVYTGDARYGGSLANLDRWPAARDFVFRDNDAAAMAAQTLALTGDPQSGYRGTATISLGA